jgi:hypothetical protein
LEDNEVLGALTKEAKQRHDVIPEYEKALGFHFTLRPSNFTLFKTKTPLARGFCFERYSGFGASTGQTVAHAPQSIHFSGSITYLSAPALIASVGHSGSQAPQLIHSSLIW